MHYIKEMADGVRDGKMKIKFIQFREGRGAIHYSATSRSSPSGLDCGTMAAIGILESRNFRKIYDSGIKLSIYWMGYGIRFEACG